MTYQKFLTTDANARCCGFSMHRAPKYVVLREPAIAFRLMSYTCQVCKRIGVTAKDIAANQHRALRVAKLVHQPTDVFKMLKAEQRDDKKHGASE